MYTAPELFKAAFSYRDFARETAFLRRIVSARRGTGSFNWLDLACGSGEHLQALAALGDKCVGVDISEETIAFARSQSPNVDFICGNVSDVFQVRQLFDAAICMNDSISHFISNAAVVGLLNNVSFALPPGGLFVVETQFSRGGQFEDKTLSDWRCTHEGRSVSVQWRDETRAGQLHSTICIECADEQGVPYQHTEHFAQRRFTRVQLESIASDFCMNCIAAYGDFDESIAMDDPAAWRAIYVFEKFPGNPVRKN